MRAKHVIKTSLKTSKARNAAQLRPRTPRKQLDGGTCHGDNLLATRAMKDTKKLERKRHTPETANWKAIHAVETT